MKLGTMSICQVLLLTTFITSCAKAQNWTGTGTWAFEPGTDLFSNKAAVDLRSLNEKFAGEHGFIKSNKNGDFIRTDGEEIRFWAVNTGVGREKPYVARPRWSQIEPDLAKHARFLAKRGVNLIRLHSQLSPDPKSGGPITDINTHERDWIWRSVAAMKKEGIYSCISPYWGVPMKFSKAWGVPGDPNQSALGLLYFDPTLQKAYKSWLKKLFTETNPNTGITLAQDPAVAIIQLQNEDSLLFWTFNGIQGPQKEALQRKFYEWVVAKYKSVGAADREWEGTKAPQDAPAGRILDFLNIWEMTQQRKGGFSARLADQLQFLSETMYNFNKEMVRYLREDLGCKQLVNPGNWRTADTVRLNDAERWSYTAGEVDAVNHYYGGIHKGPNEGWSIDVGDKFTSPSVLKEPKTLPINLKQTIGRPMMVTESGWVLPTGYASEGPLTIAAYSSLTGVDAFFWFATADEQWTPPQSANGYNDGTGKWAFGTPDVLGGFPAAAYLYRKRLLKRGTPVVSEQRTLKDIWDRRTPIIAEESGFDPNRDAGDIAPTSTVKTGVDPSAFLAGPVQASFGTAPAPSKVTLNGLLEFGKIKSNTGELMLDSQKGQFAMDSEKAQGVSAFSAGRAVFKTTDLQILSENEYFTLIAVSLDDQPLKTSSKVLIQYTTRSRPTGWKEKQAKIKTDDGKEVDGFEVVSVGKAPWRVVSALATIKVANKDLKTMSILDPNLNVRSTTALKPGTTGVSFEFPKDSLYVVLQK